jgi:hypothetical protein
MVGEAALQIRVLYRHGKGAASSNGKRSTSDIAIGLGCWKLPMRWSGLEPYVS